VQVVLTIVSILAPHAPVESSFQISQADAAYLIVSLCFMLFNNTKYIEKDAAIRNSPWLRCSPIGTELYSIAQSRTNLELPPPYSGDHQERATRLGLVNIRHTELCLLQKISTLEKQVERLKEKIEEMDKHTICDAETQTGAMTKCQNDAVTQTDVCQALSPYTLSLLL